MHLQGVFPAITTPFYPDGRIYFRKLEHNVAKYSLTGIAGFAVLGSTGEVVMLSDNEQKDVLAAAIEAAGPDKILLAGVGAESARSTVERAEQAALLGYDLALVRTPHYYKNQMTPAAMLTYYRAVADRSPLPVLLYSVPAFTGYDLPIDLIVELAQHPNIAGIKESSGSVEKIQELAGKVAGIRHKAVATLRRAKGARNMVAVDTLSRTITASEPRTHEVGFQILAGSAQKLLPSLQAGASGGVLAFANVAPSTCASIHAALRSGDMAKAEGDQARIKLPATRIASELGIAGVKYGMDFNGYYGGVPRLPLLPATHSSRADVENLLRDCRA